MKQNEEYIKSEYYQKSLNFLLPLTGLKQNLPFKPENSFLFWNEIEENIFNYHLITYYQEDVGEKNFQKFEEKYILTNNKLVSCYTVDDGIAYLFDLVEFSSDIFQFLEGKYSKYSEKAKRIILDHFGSKYDNIVSPNRPIHMVLLPQYYRDKVLKQLGQYISLEDLEKVGELANPYDKTKETFLKPIISNCECVNIKRIEYKI